MTQEKLLPVRELCLQSEAVSLEAAFFGKNYSCKIETE